MSDETASTEKVEGVVPPEGRAELPVGQDFPEGSIPKMPTGRDCTGRLPDEFVQRVIKDAEEFKRLWLDSMDFNIQQPYVLDLAWDEPFFGSLSRRIAKVKTGSIPTAGVTVGDGLMEMFWNPIFFKHGLREGLGTGAPPEELTAEDAKKLNDAHRARVRGVLKHEFYHIIFEHVTRRRQTPAVLWNVATDCAINSLIPRTELPDFCLFPGEMYIPRDAPPDWKPGLIARLIKELPAEKESEWYMSYLLQHPEVQDAMQRARARARGVGVPDPGGKGGEGQEEGEQSGGGSGSDGAFNRALEEELYGKGGGQFDDHNMWDRLSDDQRDMMRDYIRDIFRDCVREAESRSNGWGNLPESIRAHLKKLISRNVDWRELLNQFIGRSMSCRTTSSIKRVNRRAPWDFPGRKRMYSARPMLAVDESGSVSDWAVALFFAEMSTLGNLTEYDLVPFDHTVDEKNIQRVRRGTQPVLKRTRCGGTDFSAPIKYANEHRDRYDAVIILTDGECCPPIKCNVPLAYVIAPGHKLCFEPGPGVTVIQMSDTRKER